ncbi:MAG: TIGR02186 family protein [Syntrophobacteraceae bacterium]|nr:TIGR02186 family protein [Syntrophobacteraceae bacterium]
MKIRYFTLLAVLCLFSASTASAQDKLRLTVQPQTINIGTFYNGTTLTATGSIPADSEAVVRFLGDSAEVHMKQKARVAGVMWMNLGSVTFEKAPSVCIVSSAVDLKNLASKAGAADGLNLAGMRQSIQIKSEGKCNFDIFDEFLKMKKQEGLYRQLSGNISYGKPANGQKTFRALIPLPSRLKPGAYTVDVSAVGSGGIVARGEQPIEAKLVGPPALMATLAFNYPILYGVLASLIAILAGLGIGLVFQSKGAH